MNSWKLWLDDDAGKPGIEAFRNPPGLDWKVAHSTAEAIQLIEEFGPPGYISFDHDLGLRPDGTKDTAMDLIQYLTDNHYESEVDYDVHSRNVVGAPNIIAKMDSWKRSKE